MQDLTKLPDSIYFGDIESNFKTWLEQQSYSTYFVLVDSNTSNYCLPKILHLHPDIEWKVIQIPQGEAYKTITTCNEIWGTLLQQGADRHSLLVNLGGGVIGDMGGFAAGTYMRGIDFVQIPTTLLSMVDASVGGKVAVDFQLAKNIIGLFNEPAAVFIDHQWLATLPEKELRSGWAEMLKHGIIADAPAFQKMQTLSLQDIPWEEWIRHSVQIKNKVVQSDPKENGLRKGLNFGHTVGHAVETYLLAQNTPKTHGECVAIGMICASYISSKMVELPTAQLNEIVAIIKKSYDLTIIPETSINKIMELMTHDKKNRAGQPSFTLIPVIGTYIIDQFPSPALIRDSIHFYNSRLMNAS